MTGPDGNETRSYNNRLNLTRLTVPGLADIEYRYSATQNNGRITQQKDWTSGAEVTYDALLRLASAVTTDNPSMPQLLLKMWPTLNRYLLTLVFLAALQGPELRASWLYGRVIDSHGAVIPGVHVKVTSAVHTCESFSNPEGKFHCQLPPGEYAISADGNTILPYRRASLRFVGADHKFITIRPIPPPPSDQDGISAPKLIYLVQTVPVRDGAELLIRFQSSNRQGDMVHFQGEYLMLTLDALAVYAKDISCSSPITTCRAEGTVTVEVGEEELVGSRVDLDFVHRRLVLTRAPTVTRSF